ncbi:MAG: DUF3667 domain-containing protein [Alphaproteobacteria bacterium]|nr:DUF3667 domain-containing protein [Alphaproteobacteria bacterium]
MTTELETAGLASIGGLSTHQDADLSGQPCRNCQTLVSQRYCPNCGQLAASFHRPVWSLLSESINDMFAFDGRLARTLPKLFLRPGRLTRDYADGKRARYVPPFRMFLLASLVFYFTLFAMISNEGWIRDLTLDEHEAGTELVIEPDAAGLSDGLDLSLNAQEFASQDEQSASVERVRRVLDNRELFQAELEKWAPRLSVFLVPLTILALTFLHIWRRKLYVYDHAIHALHLHSWFYLIGSMWMVLSPFAGWIHPFMALLVFYYVWRSLVVATQSGWIMSFMRLLFLLLFWLVVVLVLMIGAIVMSGLEASAGA